jgi:single-strand DNA-binding protein
MINKVILLGNLGKDPEIRHLDSGVMVARFSLATSEVYKKDGQRVTQTEWHNLVAWRTNAEIIEKYVKKGDRLYIEGRIRTRNYEDNGVKKYVTEIEVESFKMLTPKHTDAPISGEPADVSSIPPPSVPEPGGDLPF